MLVAARFSRRIALAAALALPAVAGAQTFTFENIGPTGTYATDAYAPFRFSGLAQVVQDGGTYGALGCAVSGSYCLYNGFGEQNVDLFRTDGATFTIGGGYFTSWFGSSTGTVVGMLGGAQVFSQSFALTSAATRQDFGDATVDLVQFRASGQSGYFLVDDVTVNAGVVATPEPATFVLLGAGLAALGVVRRRRAAR
jgi:hypothetical protein